ncbi:MAG TPA: hypothetical protein VJR05_15765 [Acidimicrobiia bacterium]|nr:hypothetical protein [Acidimicrobiia bacterium]
MTSEADPTPESGEAVKSRWRWLKQLPTWLQWGAGVVGPLLALLAFFGIRGLSDPKPSRVEIGSTTVQTASIDLAGTYRNLGTSETVVVIIRQTDNGANTWAAAEATRSPSQSAEAEGESGRWEASIPASDGTFEVTAAIVPALGVGGFSESQLNDLRQLGPESDQVIESTPIVTVNG